ncbi:N-acetyltransferase [Thalassotalea insulae]|uniref:N-acetyltransferase n=1 Tax=Thalassotalea insulae TaxID=2056778 RepID=A0ABQ6GTD7_9GAMM|nr:GNAT family N-acetyltransferase [Thalassotalea insulae]GLX79211.1 N-acetyltransferase [Thalassotalea insulae]
MEKMVNRQGVNFLLSDDKSKLELSVIHGYLTQCYWSAGISEILVAKAIANSLCFGLYLNQQQIGFARVTTDKATFAYLADVFVLSEYEQRGLGTTLIDFLLQHPDLQGLRRFMLCTRDAHGLYKKFGFTGVENPEIMMQLNKPDLYIKALAN